LAIGTLIINIRIGAAEMFIGLSDLELFDLATDCFREYLTHGNYASLLEFVDCKKEILVRMADVD
jgi:hypothetical protein